MKILIEKLKSIEKKELQTIIFGAIAFLAFLSFIFFAVKSPKGEEILFPEKDCEEEGGYWYQESCYKNINMVLGMFNAEECEREGFYWYNDSCNELKEELSLEELFNTVEERIIYISNKVKEKKGEEYYEIALSEFQKIESNFLEIGQSYINEDYEEEEITKSLKDILNNANALNEKIDSGVMLSQEAEEEEKETEITPTPQEIKPTPTVPKKLTEFEKRAKCIADGHYWYNSTCNEQPQQTTESMPEDTYTEPESSNEYEDYDGDNYYW
jgi:hypothetical protein